LGLQGSYLIDFYHVCDYLSAAAKTIAPDAAAQKAWMEAQKDARKSGRLDHTLQALARHFEAPEVGDEQAPVRCCYLSERRNQLNYRLALAQVCRSAPERSRARIAISRNNASSEQERGGGWNTPNTCSRCASIAETATGALIGPRSAETPRPRRRRKSKPAKDITKIRSVIASLWIAPDKMRALDATRRLRP
jgi:hypothetical protein